MIEYNHFMLKGNLQRKKEILLALGRALEAKRNVLKGINMSLADKIFCLYNNLNLRHNNVEQGKNYHKTVDEMKPKQIESWYDELYQMVLLAYLLMENEKRNNEVQKLIQQINSEEKNNGQA